MRQRWMRYRKSTGELKSELGKVLVENRATSISSVRSNDDGGVVKKLRASHQLYLLNGTRVCRETFAAALDEPEDFIKKASIFGHKERSELPMHHATEAPQKTLMVQWLREFAVLTSERMPGGGAPGSARAEAAAVCRDDAGVLRLAECRLKDVWKKYQMGMLEMGQSPLSYECMRLAFTSDERLVHIKLSRRRGNVGGLGICATCESLKEQLYMVRSFGCSSPSPSPSPLICR